VEVPHTQFNCYETCYNTNMVTDISFGTLKPSIRKTIWSQHYLLQLTVKWLDNFF